VTADGSSLHLRLTIERNPSPRNQRRSTSRSWNLRERHRSLRSCRRDAASAPSTAPAMVDPGWSHHWRTGGPIPGGTHHGGPTLVAGDTKIERSRDVTSLREVEHQGTCQRETRAGRLGSSTTDRKAGADLESSRSTTARRCGYLNGDMLCFACTPAARRSVFWCCTTTQPESSTTPRAPKMRWSALGSEGGLRQNEGRLRHRLPGARMSGVGP
jgi:hypothetical protein